MFMTNPEPLPPALQALLERWKVKKEDYREAFHNGWPAKYVQTFFELDGEEYCITPDMIGLTKGNCWDEGFMEFLQGHLEADLKEIGATKIGHLGFID